MYSLKHIAIYNTKKNEICCQIFKNGYSTISATVGQTGELQKVLLWTAFIRKNKVWFTDFVHKYFVSYHNSHVKFQRNEANINIIIGIEYDLSYIHCQYFKIKRGKSV